MWLKQGRNFFLTSQSWEIKNPNGLFLVRHYSWFAADHLLPSSHDKEQGKRKCSLLHLIRTLKPFVRSPYSSPSYLPKVPPTNATTFLIRISVNEFWENPVNNSHNEYLSFFLIVHIELKVKISSCRMEFVIMVVNFTENFTISLNIKCTLKYWFGYRIASNMKTHIILITKCNIFSWNKLR